ncbi:hypothetical protein SAMN02745176_01970 [Lutispora thermophila DSM 19022]|uniref:Uncharacterized protein n=1 Tax=Lutispora thermophila DSM 19022 TaxID=1122184 RepID=A0A1M6FHU9_9FIRM|nr:hypothetical protein SAMN02745176_01970 [Lutispora thermophila DSM 19022]
MDSYLFSYISFTSEPSNTYTLSISSLIMFFIFSPVLNLTQTPQLELSFLGTGIVSEDMFLLDKNLLYFMAPMCEKKVAI